MDWASHASSRLNTITPTSARCRGLTMIWVVISLAALLAFFAMGIDVMYMVVTAKQLSAGADAASLAAAAVVRTDQDYARDLAVYFASRNTAAGDPIQLDINDANAIEGDVIVGRWDRAEQTFTVTTDFPNAVRIAARRTDSSLSGALPLLFAPIFGIDTANVERHAIAMAIPSAVQGLGIIVLRPSGPDAFQHSGNGTISVNGPIEVKSSSSKALTQSGNGTLEAAVYRVRGDVYQSGGGEIIGPIETGVTDITDPLIGLPVLGASGLVVRATNPVQVGNTNRTLEPGIYKQGIELGGSGTLTMNPGLYRIESKGFKISGNGRLIANKVFLYNGVGSNTDQILISSDAHVTWTPPDSGTYEGIAMFQDRSSDKKLQISGNGSTQISGTVYAAGAQVQLSGNGQTDILAGAVIANTVQVSGDGEIGIDPTGGQAAGRDIVFLVH